MLVEEPVINTSEGSPEQGSSANIEQQISWPANKGRKGGQPALERSSSRTILFNTHLHLVSKTERLISRFNKLFNIMDISAVLLLRELGIASSV